MGSIIANDDARDMADGIAQRSRNAFADGPRRSIASMLPAAHLEWTQRPGRRHPHLTDVVDDRRRWTGAEQLEQDVEPIAGTLGDAPDRTVPGVGDPAVEPQVHRLAQHEIAEADALDPSADGGIEPRGRCFGEQRSAVRRPRCATAS